jgi:hypothetical protein
MGEGGWKSGGIEYMRGREKYEADEESFKKRVEWCGSGDFVFFGLFRTWSSYTSRSGQEGSE